VEAITTGQLNQHVSSFKHVNYEPGSSLKLNDICTKALPNPAFETLTFALGLKDPSGKPFTRLPIHMKEGPTRGTVHETAAIETKDGPSGDPFTRQTLQTGEN